MLGLQLNAKDVVVVRCRHSVAVAATAAKRRDDADAETAAYSTAIHPSTHTPPLPAPVLHCTASYTTLHSITTHYTTLHYTLHYTTHHHSTAHHPTHLTTTTLVLDTFVNPTQHKERQRRVTPTHHRCTAHYTVDLTSRSYTLRLLPSQAHRIIAMRVCLLLLALAALVGGTTAQIGFTIQTLASGFQWSNREQAAIELVKKTTGFVDGNGGGITGRPISLTNYFVHTHTPTDTRFCSSCSLSLSRSRAHFRCCCRAVLPCRCMLM